jgi:hypothetical protein
MTAAGGSAGERRPSIPEAFRKIVSFLEQERIPYVLIGGLAASLHGEPRTTDDVDTLVSLPSREVPRIARQARAEGFDIEPDHAETQWLASGVLRLWYGPSGQQVACDLMARSTDFLREVVWRAQPFRFMGREVPVASPEDVLLFKLSSWREKDIPDARSIVRRHHERLDLAYLRRWAAWFVEKNPVFKDVPARLEALLADEEAPPAARG